MGILTGDVGPYTSISSRDAELTARLPLPVILPNLAVTVAEPTATAVAKPLLSTVATDVFDELQVTCVVRS